MKTIIRICIRNLILTFAVLIMFSGCKKENDLVAPILFNPSINYGSMTDQDGNIYKTVTIGTQVWMAENLRTTKYRNGDPIPNVTDADKWQYLKTGAYCCYDNNGGYVDVYGLLYNGHAANDSRNIAPDGWHVATTEDWVTLTNFLGGEELAAQKLKEKGTGHWSNTSNYVTNSTGFTALPGGIRHRWQSIAGVPVNMPFEFMDIGGSGIWWTPTCSWTINLSSSYEPGCYSSNSGLSVRCVKD